MAHTFAGRGCDTRNIGNHRLGDIGLDEQGGLFLSRTANLANHHYCLGLVVFLQQAQDIDET